MHAVTLTLATPTPTLATPTLTLATLTLTLATLTLTLATPTPTLATLTPTLATPGFGFVTFERAEDAKAAVDQKWVQVNEKQVCVWVGGWVRVCVCGCMCVCACVPTCPNKYASVTEVLSLELDVTCIWETTSYLCTWHSCDIACDNQLLCTAGGGQGSRES